MTLVKDTITIGVGALKCLDKEAKELLVLLELEVQHSFQEDGELKLRGFLIIHLTVEHATSHGSLPLEVARACE